MANIDISQNKLEEATSYLIQYLRDSGFEGSTEAGTAIYDVLIRPNALLYNLISDTITRVKAYNSITAATEARSLIGESEYNKAIDSILSNWFVTRKSGSKSTCTIRLFFTRVMPYFLIDSDGTSKASINGVNYDVVRQYVLSETNFSSIYNSERNAVEYYTDIDLHSLDNVAATTGTLIVNINSIYLLRGTLIGSIKSGIPFESSEDFIKRTQQVITTRELISDNAIYTALAEVFADLREIYIAGFGDTEQLRDIVNFQEIDIHVGNKADIYLNLPLSETLVSCPMNSIGVVNLSGITQHIVDVINVRHKLLTKGSLRLYCSVVPQSSVVIGTSVEFVSTGEASITYKVKETTTILTTDWLASYTPNISGVYFDIDVISDAFSTADDVVYAAKNEVIVVPSALVSTVNNITAADTFLNLNIPFVLSTSTLHDIGTVGLHPICTITDSDYIGSITDCWVLYTSNTTFLDAWNYITDASNRVVCYDPSIKSKFIIYLDCEITIATTGLSTLEEIETEKLLCQTAVINYINDLKKEEVYIVFDMLVAIKDACSHIYRVKSPVAVTYSFQDPESLIYYTGTVTDSFTIKDITLGLNEELSLMVSENTIQYYTNIDKVIVNIDAAYF